MTDDGSPGAGALVDSHCHLTHPRFDGDREGVLERARSAGVRLLVTIASDVDDARGAIDLAGEHPDVRATAGVHPHHVGAADPDDLALVRELAGDRRVVAIGETGLDYHYDNAPRETQRRWFRRQAALAGELDLPLVVHSREADADTIAVLRELVPGTRGVLHCFTAGRELLEAGLDAGWYVSFSGIVTFGSFEDEELVRAVPGDRLLIETDSPFLAPVPRRGRRNEPAYVAHVRDAVARIRAEEPEELGRRTAENAARLYRIEGG